MSSNDRSQFSKDTILEATLYTLLEHGIKGIKFQSVSERAGVYPSSIAYHFNSIDKLIEAAFVYYLDHYNREMAEYRQNAQALIHSFSQSPLHTKEDRQRVLEQYSHVLAEVATPSEEQHVYLMELDRLFRNELASYPAIAKKIAAQDQADIELMASFFELFNSSNPKADAFHLMALLSYLYAQFLQQGAKASSQKQSQALILSLLKKSV